MVMISKSSRSRRVRTPSCCRGFEPLEERCLPSGASATPAALAFVPDGVNQAITTDPGVQHMPSVAADPLDSKHLVLAYMDRSLVTTGYAGIGVAVSHDDGLTWQHTALPLPAG